MIAIKNHPLSLHEQGKRQYNQDNIYPGLHVKESTGNLYMVCDGVGGSQRGDVASKLTCEYVADYFKRNSGNRKVDAAFINDAIKETIERLALYAKEHPETERMATTLTLLHIGEDGCTVAWVGDSRVYHISKGVIKFKTKDHSLVQMLINHGEITEEQARAHPQKNLITRSISLSKEPIVADVFFIPNNLISNDDYFFLCTDGVVESFTNEQFSKLMDGTRTSEEIIQIIRENCIQTSHDNFSCYLIQVHTEKPAEKVTPTVKLHAPKDTSPVGPSTGSRPKSEKLTEKTNDKTNKKLILISVGVLLIGVLAFAILLPKSPPPKNNVKTEKQDTQTSVSDASSKSESAIKAHQLIVEKFNKAEGLLLKSQKLPASESSQKQIKPMLDESQKLFEELKISLAEIGDDPALDSIKFRTNAYLEGFKFANSAESKGANK